MTLTQKDAYQLIHKGCAALAEVEANGIRIDTEYLQKATERTKRRIAHLQRSIKKDEVYALWRKVYGVRTNTGSRDQLGKILFNHMGIECKHFTKTGKPSVTEESLEEIGLQLPKNIIQVEKLKKVIGTYLNGIQREVVDGILHPNYNLHTTVTYRSSSSAPNFQNIPIRNPEMKKLIRPCFIPRDGCVLIESDYGRLEVCVAGCYTEDLILLDYIKDKSKDMHRDMAAECFMTSQDEVSKDARSTAKAEFVFKQFYGGFYGTCASAMWDDISKHKLQTISGTPLKEVLRRKGIKSLGDCAPKGIPLPGTFAYHMQQVTHSFWKKRFKRYDAWKRERWDQYERDGYFTTLTGFKISRGEQGADLNRREVSNYPIQGSGFHCLLWTLIKLSDALRKHKMKSKIVGQIHDSILADVPTEEVADYVALTNEIATVDIKKAWDWIIVPLEMDFEACPVGGSWYDKKLMEV